MQERSIGDGVGITLVFDGTSKTIVGNFLGVYFIPPRGDYEWHAVNGDWGSVDTPLEARQEIEAAWKRG